MVLLKDSNLAGSQLLDEPVLIVACSIGAVLSLVFAVLGIKLKWFKHRLNFQTGSSASSSSQITAPVETQGVFRRRIDADIYYENERPKSLPPVRIRKQSKPVNIPVPPKRTHKKLSTRDTSAADLPELPASPPPYQAHDNEHDFIIISHKRSEPQPTIHQPVTPSDRIIQLGYAENGKQQPKYPISPPEVVSTSRRATQQNKEKKHRSKSQSPVPTETRNVVKETKHIDQKNEKSAKSKSLNPLANKNSKTVASLPNDNQSLSKDKKSKEGFSKKLAFNFGGSAKPKAKDKKEKENEIAKRRPTGFVRPPKVDVDQLEASMGVNNVKVIDGKPVLHLAGETKDSDDDDEVFERVKHKPKATVENVPITPPKTEDEDDAWSAVARRRNLTQEISKQSALVRTKTLEQLNAPIEQDESRPFINPLANPKPRNMRDMKKTQEKKKENEKNSINLGSDNAFDTEA